MISHYCRVLAFVFLSLFSLVSHADDYLAGPQFSYGFHTGTDPKAFLDKYCSLYAPTAVATFIRREPDRAANTQYSTDCTNGQTNVGGWSSYSCPYGGTTDGGSLCTGAPACQAGATRDAVTGECKMPVCPAGQTTLNGQCSQSDEQRCKDSQSVFNSTLGERYVDVEMPGQISSGTSLCVPSSTPSQSGGVLKCSMNFERNISFQDAKGAWVSRGQLDMGGMVGNYSTLPCGQSSTVPQVVKENLNPPCPAGEQPGTVNGATVCKPYGPDVTAKTTDKTTSTTNADGSTTASTTTTECKGASCTTTTSTTNGTGTSSTSSTSSKDSFCVANSGSAQCGGASGGGDSGGCDAAADTVGCSKFGEPGATPPTPNENIPLTFSREAGFGPSNASCPAPRVLNIPGGRTISMSFDMYCTFAQGMRPFIIGFALLSAAGMVVFGATRKG